MTFLEKLWKPFKGMSEPIQRIRVLVQILKSFSFKPYFYN